MKNLPNVITFPPFRSITDDDNDGEEEEYAIIRDIAEQYLRKLLRCRALLRRMDYGIRVISFTLGSRKHK